MLCTKSKIVSIGCFSLRDGRSVVGAVVGRSSVLWSVGRRCRGRSVVGAAVGRSSVLRSVGRRCCGRSVVGAAVGRSSVKNLRGGDMGFAARIFMALVTKFKGLGFLEWAGIASLIDTILTYDVKQQLFKIVAEEMSAKAGLELNPEDPFSDASVSNAISQKIGVPLRSIKNKQMILEDVDDFAAARLSEKLGVKISSIKDPAKAKQDLEAAGLALVSAKTGIPFSVPEGEAVSAEVVRGQVIAWARAEVSLELAESANTCLSQMGAEGVDFEATAAVINGKLQAMGVDTTVSAGRVAMYVAESLVRDAVRQYGAVAGDISKATRRRLQLRDAQQRFRSRHGNRQVYMPI